MAVVTMSNRIDLERKNMDPVEILDLNLDGCLATEVEGLSNEFSNLQSLSLRNVGLKTLNGFPSLSKLQKLNLSDNPIVDGVDALCGCINLTSLNLSGNLLKNVRDLAPLSELKHLTSLDLNNCELARLENYRKDIFTLLPGLKYLDGLDRNGDDEPVFDEHKNGVVVNKSDALTKNVSQSCSENEDEDEADNQEVGLSALQGDQLEDDEEDYVPGEDDDEIDDEDDEDDEDDTDDDDDEEDEDDDELDDDEIANLSASGVTESRRAIKRPIAEGDDIDKVAKSKCVTQNQNGEEVSANGGEEGEY